MHSNTIRKPYRIPPVFVWIVLFPVFVGIALPVAALGSREGRAGGQVTEVSNKTDFTVPDGQGVRVGADIRASGRIAIYGNEPFTFPALRTEVPVALLDDVRADTPDRVPWLLELNGMELDEIVSWQERAVIVTGTLRRLPSGPRQGLLEVKSIEEDR